MTTQVVTEALSPLSHKGNTSVLAIAMAWMEAGRWVALPLGDGQRYDLIVDHDGSFDRVQVKTARMVREDTLAFKTSSSDRGGMHRSYEGQIETFGVWVPEIRLACSFPANLFRPCGRELWSLKVARFSRDEAERYRIGPVRRSS